MQLIKGLFLMGAIALCSYVQAQEKNRDEDNAYKKRVLETAEIDFLGSLYTQEGNNAAVTGGRGTEELTDIAGSTVIAIPLTADDVLTIDAGFSSYSSASSSNVNPRDGNGPADPFQASSGASGSDVWSNLTGNWSHSSDDRNEIYDIHGSVSSEYDYSSFGFGGGFTKLINEKNTTLSVTGNVYLDEWKVVYPIELRGDQSFTPHDETKRNSYTLGLGINQVLSKSIQGGLALDITQQTGLLSTPFQRVYFSDQNDRFFERIALADDVERLPDSHLKIALGSRLNVYVNEYLVVRNFYRYYISDWGISSLTASIELPIKVTSKFTLYPNYRYYAQTAADYFAPYNQHLSTDRYYTSDYDLSEYQANQLGMGIKYSDVISPLKVGKIAIKSIDIRYHYYKRSSSLFAHLISGGVKIVID